MKYAIPGKNPASAIPSRKRAMTKLTTPVASAVPAEHNPQAEGGAAGDHEEAFDPRESGGEPLGDDVGEVILRRIAAQIREGQHDHGQARRRR